MEPNEASFTLIGKSPIGVEWAVDEPPIAPFESDRAVLEEISAEALRLFNTFTYPDLVAQRRFSRFGEANREFSGARLTLKRIAEKICEIFLREEKFRKKFPNQKVGSQLQSVSYKLDVMQGSSLVGSAEILADGRIRYWNPETGK